MRPYFWTRRCRGYDATTVDVGVNVFGCESDSAATVADSDNGQLSRLDHLVNETNRYSQSLGDIVDGQKSRRLRLVHWVLVGSFHIAEESMCGLDPEQVV